MIQGFQPSPTNRQINGEWRCMWHAVVGVDADGFSILLCGIPSCLVPHAPVHPAIPSSGFLCEKCQREMERLGAVMIRRGVVVDER